MEAANVAVNPAAASKALLRFMETSPVSGHVPARQPAPSIAATVVLRQQKGLHPLQRRYGVADPRGRNAFFLRDGVARPITSSRVLRCEHERARGISLHMGRTMQPMKLRSQLLLLTLAASFIAAAFAGAAAWLLVQGAGARNDASTLLA